MTAPLVVGFDLDQTLVDSSARIVASHRMALRTLGLPDVEPAAFGALFGLPLDETIRRIAPGADVATYVPAYRRAYDVDHEAVTEPMPHARAALTAVHDRGGRCVVVSAKHEPVVGVALREAGLADLVDACRGDLFGAAKGPALHDLGARVYVGDHPGDVEAGHAAGAVVVGVATGSHDARALTDAGADVVVADLSGLPAALDRLLA